MAAPTWPPEQLETPLTGDTLYTESVETLTRETALQHWEGNPPAAWKLADTPTPGDVHFNLTMHDGPWFTEDEWALPPSCDWAWVQSISAMVRAIFGDNGLMPAPRDMGVTGGVNWGVVAQYWDAATAVLPQAQEIS